MNKNQIYTGGILLMITGLMVVLSNNGVDRFLIAPIIIIIAMFIMLYAAIYKSHESMHQGEDEFEE